MVGAGPRRLKRAAAERQTTKTVVIGRLEGPKVPIPWKIALFAAGPSSLNARKAHGQSKIAQVGGASCATTEPSRYIHHCRESDDAGCAHARPEFRAHDREQVGAPQRVPPCLKWGRNIGW